MQIYVDENFIEIRHEELPKGWVEVDVYHPCSSVTPWDSYGRQRQRLMARVLLAAGIESLALVTHHRNTIPMGTGPGGRVRFGDDMLPGTYRTAVKAEHEPAARAAIAAHEAEVSRWVDGMLAGGSPPMPAVLRE